MALGIFGSESNLLRYDMSEYQTLNDVPKFKNEIADAVVKYPYSIFLFDEIEKSTFRCYGFIITNIRCWSIEKQI